MMNLLILRLKDRITLNIGELNRFLLITIISLHKERRGSARRAAGLRKKITRVLD